MQNVKGPLGSKLNNLCQTIVVVFKIAFDVIFISSSLQRIGIISIHNEHKKNGNNREVKKYVTGLTLLLRMDQAMYARE